MTEEASREEIQQMLNQYQMLSAQTEVLEKHREMLNQSMEELDTAIDTISDMKNVEKGSAVMIPLGGGSYMKGEVHSTEDVLVNIGADTLVRKSTADAVEVLEKRKEEVDEKLQELTGELKKAQMGIRALEPKIQQLSQGR